MNTLFGDIFSKVPVTKLSRYEFGSNSDLNYLVWGYIRLHINNNTKYNKTNNISQDIILLFIEYIGCFINSNILMVNMNVYLIQLLESQNVKCSLSRKIFNAKFDGFDSKSFYQKFKQHYNYNNNTNNHNKKTKTGSVLIIKTKKGNIFGGFTKTKWILNGSSYDEKAFLFSLFHPTQQTQHKQQEEEEENKDISDLFSFEGQQKLESQIDGKIYRQSSLAAAEIFAVCKPKNYNSDYIFFWGSPNSLYIETNCDKSNRNFLENGGFILQAYKDRAYFTVDDFEIFELG